MPRNPIGPRLAAALAGAVALTAAGAADAQQFQCPRNGGNLILALEARVPNLDQHANPSAATRNVANNIFESLLTRDDNMNPIPQLAAAIEEGDNGRRYTFRLREGVRFHNGKVMTSADVLASFQRYRQVGNDRSILDIVERMETPDPNTFVLTLREARPTFIEQLSAFSAPIVIIPSENAGAPLGQLQPVGTGPFQFGEFVADSHVRIRRFDGYQPDTRYQGIQGFGGFRQACVDTVTFRMITESGARTAALETGEIHITEDVPTASIRRLQGNRNIRLQRVDNFALLLTYPNFSQGPTDNLRVRQAIMASLNMEEIMEAATDGAFRLNPSLQFPGQAYHSTAGREFYDQRNPARARELLREAGYRGERVILLTNREFSTMYNASLVMSEQMKAAGINAELLVLDWPAALQMSNTNSGWNFFFTFWSTVTAQGGPQSLRNLADPSNVHRPVDNRSDPEFMAQFRLVNDAPTLEQRREAFARAQARALEQGMVVPFGIMAKTQATRANVEGFRPFFNTRVANVSLSN